MKSKSLVNQNEISIVINSHHNLSQGNINSVMANSNPMRQSKKTDKNEQKIQWPNSSKGQRGTQSVLC